MKTETPNLNGTIRQINNFIFSNPGIQLSNVELLKTNYYFKTTYNMFNYFLTICKDLSFARDLTLLINTDKKLYSFFINKVLPFNIMWSNVEITTNDSFLTADERMIKNVKMNIEVGKSYLKEELKELFKDYKKLTYLNILKCFFSIKIYKKKKNKKVFEYVKILNRKPFDFNLNKLVEFYHVKACFPKQLELPLLKQLPNNRIVNNSSLTDIITITDNRTNEIVFEGTITEAVVKADFKYNSIKSTLTFSNPIYLSDYKIVLNKKNENNLTYASN